MSDLTLEQAENIVAEAERVEEARRVLPRLKAEAEATDRQLKAQRDLDRLTPQFEMTQAQHKEVTEEARAAFRDLVQAFNQIAKIYKEKLGVYLVTQNQRKSKEELLQKFALLHNLFVDNNGTISIIRGKEDEVPTDSLEAFALWISFFIQLCSRYEPELSTDIKYLTLGFEDKLEQMGFYETYDKIKRT